MQLDGPFGWCGVCHSKEPGQAGYCPHHDETSIDNDQVSFVKTVQICSKLSNFELRSLLVFFLLVSHLRLWRDDPVVG